MIRTSATGSASGLYVDRNAFAGVRGTDLVAADRNMIQEELANFVELFGIALDGGNDQQLYDTVVAKLPQLDANSIFTGIPAFNGGTTESTAPFTVDSTFLVSNLNADMVDGIQGSNIAKLDTANTFTAIPAFNGGTSGATAPFTVDSTFLVSDLNAQYVNGNSCAAGIYTPTVSAASNVTGITASPAQYIRVSGAVSAVNVSGRLDFTVTTAATDASFELALPVASNIGATYHSGGTGVSLNNGNVASISGVAANDTVQVLIDASKAVSGATAIFYNYTYQII